MEKELSYTSEWPGGLRVVTVIRPDGVVEECLSFPPAGLGQGRRLEISQRKLSEAEQRLVAKVRPNEAAPEASFSAAHGFTVTYNAEYPNGISVLTVVAREWAQDSVSYEHGHPVHGYAGALHDKRPPSAIELMLLDTLAPH